MDSSWKYTHVGQIKKWHEGLMLGNGFLGTLIYGEKDLIFSLDRVDLWDNRISPECLEDGFTYQNMIKTMKNNWDEYLRLFDNCYNHPYPTKLNAGSLIFKTNISENDKFELDIKKATFRLNISNENYHGYLDANKDVLVIFCPKSAQFSFKLPEYLSSNDEKTGLGYQEAIEKTEDEFRYVIQRTKANFTFGILVLDTYINKGRLLLTTIVKGSDEKTLIENGKKYLKTYLKDINNSKNNHLLYWKKYFDTSTVTTHDEMIDRQYNLSRYFFACNSRRKYPVSLEGIWTCCNGEPPPWKGDYHSDINLQMSYEAYMKTGNESEGKVLVNFLWENRNKFHELAKTFCHTDGYFIPGVMSQDCSPLGGWPMYSLNPCVSIWLSTAFDNYYHYYGGENFLKKKAYPFLANIEKCISSLLVTSEDGYLQLEFSSSPEINDGEKESILKHQSNFEISLLHFLYETLIEYCQILNLDNTYYKKQLLKLRDYAKNKKGEFIIAKDLDYEGSHRHFSHILCHKNLELLTPYNDSSQIFKDYTKLEKLGHDQWVGFSFTEASSLASYIGLGEEAYKHLYIFCDGFVNENGFHMNMDFKHKGYSNIISNAFTLEANFGFIRALTDMMLRTTKGVITVFPAIPAKFIENNVSFENLRSYGNHKINGSYKNGKKNFFIKLSKPGIIKLYNNISDKVTLIVDDIPTTISSKIGEIVNIFATESIKYMEE